MSIKIFSDKDWSLSFSDQTDPFFNLSWEAEILKGKRPQISHLFLYRNRPCIVSGRFQVPWREINFHAPQFKDITYVRRRSGGGTVYHDLGNWNFCIIRKGRELGRSANLLLIQTVLKKLGVEVHQNERFDLFYKGNAEEKLKVSGSAFKQTANMNLHHGTLLVESSLKSLKGTLGVTKDWEVTGKGIASFPSPVTNINEHGHQLNFEDWKRAWMSHFGFNELIFSTPDSSQFESMKREEETLKSWQWRWGETPHHEICWKYLEMELKLGIKKGQIVSQSFNNFAPEINLIGNKVLSNDLDSLKSHFPDYFQRQLGLLGTK